MVCSEGRERDLARSTFGLNAWQASCLHYVMLERAVNVYCHDI